MRPLALLLPTDNRPVTYTFPQLICQLADIDVLMPPRHLMGSLQAPTDLSLLVNWVKDNAAKINSGVMLICFDSLLYGGLIPARRSDDKLETILKRLADIVNLRKLAGRGVKLYAQSSIMRISDNYDNTEEKLYWSQCGREIFLWSKLLHKKELGMLESEAELKAIESRIKPEVREDYLATRARNFAVNQKMIDYAVSSDIDFLIFSQDDSGQYGLNVSEKEKLLSLAKAKNVHNVLAYPGADEMLMTLIARYLNSERSEPPEVTLQYSSPNGKNISSNYEGQNIGRSLDCQCQAHGLKVIDADISSRSVDFHIIVHTGADKQGDHIWLPGLTDLRQVDSGEAAKRVIDLLNKAHAPVVICDLAYSNGSDPLLISLLLQRPDLLEKIWAYAGWNTTGNAVGSALSIACACLHAHRSDEGLDEAMRKKLLFIRLMDDWAYQTQVRKEIRDKNAEDKEQELLLSRLMAAYAQQLAKVLGFQPGKIEYAFPWQRTFEVEINIDPQFVASIS